MHKEMMTAMLAVDDHHWWFRGRRQIIRTELDRLPLVPGARVLDAGCGSGRTLVELVDYGEAAGLELDSDAAQLARDRGIAEIQVGRLEELPWPQESFDLITCLDVIEHTQNDRLALGELHRVCKPGGFLLVTVPAYQALWSMHDEANHHYRRYSRRALREAARGAGWEIARMTSFNSVLLAPAAVIRISQRRTGSRNGYTNSLDVPPRWLNRALEQPLRLEAGWLRHGGTLPAGLSLLAMLRKPWTNT
jgi:SAM-dependent methyltransferase